MLLLIGLLVGPVGQVVIPGWIAPAVASVFFFIGAAYFYHDLQRNPPKRRDHDK